MEKLAKPGEFFLRSTLKGPRSVLWTVNRPERTAKRPVGRVAPFKALSPLVFSSGTLRASLFPSLSFPFVLNNRIT